MSHNFEEKRHWFLEHPVISGIGCLICYYITLFILTYLLRPLLLQPTLAAGLTLFLTQVGLAAAFSLVIKAVLGSEYTIGFTGKNLAICVIMQSVLISASLISMTVNEFNPAWYLHITSSAVLTALLLGAKSGAVEEILFRGIIASNMMRVWGQKPLGIYAVVILSSLIFGGTHILNCVWYDITPVLKWQMVCSFAVGMVFAAAYLRTGNLWGLILMHTLLESAEYITATGCVSGNPIADYLSRSVSSTAAAASCLLIAACLAVSLYLIRPAKQAEIRAVWNHSHPEEENTAVSVISQAVQA